MLAVREPALADRWVSTRRLLRLSSCFRLNEVLVLQGTPLLGALFAMGRLTGARCLDVLVLALASLCLVAHVFVLNDLCGARADLRDPHRATRVFMARGIGGREVGALCALLLAVSLILIAPFGPTPLLIALALAALSALYSAPMFELKGVPVLSTVLHVLGGLLHFLLGYSLFRAIDGRSLAIGGFFALTFAAGHLTHEARDYGGDRLNRIRTNAVAFGRARSFAAGFLLFTAADVLLVALAIRDIVPHILVLVAGLYTLHLWWALRTSLAGLTFESIRQLQVRYRALYAIIGLLMAAAICS